MSCDIQPDDEVITKNMAIKINYKANFTMKILLHKEENDK